MRSLAARCSIVGRGPNQETSMTWWIRWLADRITRLSCHPGSIVLPE